MSEAEEILALDLDIDLVNHLAIPESVLTLRSEGISTDLIEDEDVAEVFTWQIEHSRDLGRPATASVLEDEFDWVEIEEPLTVVEDLILRLKQRYIRNHAREELNDLVDQFKDNPDSIEIATSMIRKGQELAKIVVKRGDTYGTGDFERSMRLYDKMVLQGRGPSFGFEEVDEHFHGQRGLSFILGAPKSYKSWININSALQNIQEDRKVALWSLELPAHEADMRLRCMAANIPWWKYLKGAISHEERQHLKEVSEVLDDLGQYKIMKPPTGERKAEMMVERARDWGAEIIYIDQLQYVETNSGRTIGAKNDTGDYWEVLDKLRDYSDDGPITIVHQFNRSVMNADELPSMQQIKGSSAIEETATLALGLWANKDMRASNVVGLGTLASRNYEWLRWDISVKLSRDCKFELIGRVDDD